MKKAFYSLLGLFMVASATYAQTEYKKIEDLTKAKLVNADFKADNPVSVTIRTYDYDLTDEGAGNGGTGLFGQQTITGWTAAAPSDNIKVSTSSSDARTDGVNARAAGIFEFLDENGDGVTYSLGGDTYERPYILPGEHEGPALGMLAVWGAEIQYTQEVTLAPGAYLIEIPICNTHGNGGMVTLNGFIASDGTRHMSTLNEYQVDYYAWTTDQIAFILDKETTGVISIGYKSGGQGSADSPHLYYEGVKLYKIDPQALIEQQIATAKEDLLKVIEAGEQVGANTRAAEAVYNNANATLEEVLKAIEDQKALNDAAVIDLSESFITNPHFNQDDAIPAGEGITTYDYDREKNSVSYYGMQPVKGWVASHPAASVEDNPLDANTGVNNGRACGVVSVGSGVWLGGSQFQVPMTMSDGATEGNLLGFVTCWSATTQYTQGVTIPAGQYTLTISYYNTGGASAVAKNLMGFIANNGEEYLSDVTTFKVGSWEKMQVSFVLDEATAGKFSVGYTAANTGSGNMPHFFIDGISLNYVGNTDIDPSLFALQAAVSSGQELLNENFYADLKEEFQKAVEAGESLVNSQSSDTDANAAATEAINGRLEEIEASIKAYEKLASFRENELEAAYNKYESFPALHSQLDELIDEIDTDALSDYTWSTEKINETIASLDPMIKEAIQARFDEIINGGEEVTEPFDITAITPGLAYTYSTTSQTGANVPDKEWAYGTASNFKTQFGTAEVWNQSPFEVKRTLTDMPAGTYTVTTRAFYRTAENQTNYDNYDRNNHAAFLWAGHAKAPLTNVVELASADGEGYTNPAEVNGMFIPNNQQTAHDIFVNDKYKAIVETSVSTVLTEPGDLSFGICANEMESNSWVVWYSFELAYKSVDNDVLAQEVEGLVEEAETMLDVTMVTKAATNLDKAIKQGEAAVSSGKVDDLVAASNALNDAIAYANNSAPLIEKLFNLAEKFTVILESAGIEGTDETIIKIITAANADEFDSNEQIEGYIKDIPAAWTKYVVSQSGVKSASDAEPFDLTPAIVNAGFEMGDLTGWNAASGTGDTGVKENSNATYTINNAEGSYVFNTWNSTAIDFFLNQTIEGLPAGTYRLEAIFAGDADNVVTLEVAGSTVDVTTTDKIEGIETALDFNVTAGQAVTINVTSPSWFKADNFRLTYFGTNSANAIANVESATAASTVYSVAGARSANLQKGVNIVKYTDGSVKKVLVK